jgi:hypothetical protein
VSCWIVAWIIAEAIPVFSDLNGLIVSQALSPGSFETYANCAVERALRQLVQLWTQWCLLASFELWAVVRQPSKDLTHHPQHLHWPVRSGPLCLGLICLRHGHP